MEKTPSSLLPGFSFAGNNFCSLSMQRFSLLRVVFLLLIMKGVREGRKLNNINHLQLYPSNPLHSVVGILLGDGGDLEFTVSNLIVDLHGSVVLSIEVYLRRGGGRRFVVNVLCRRRWRAT